MNRKCVLVLTVFVLSSACFCQELPDIKDTLETDRQQYAVIADTIAAAKDSAAAAAHSAWLEESNNPQSAHIISFESIPEPQRNVVGQYYEQFAGYLQTCDGMNLQNTVKKANEEFPYFLRVNFKFFDFKLDLGHNSGTVLSQMLDWSLSCRLTSEDILTVYALNKPFHDNPSQLEILSKAAKVDSFKAAAKFFAERPVCKLSCKKSFLKEALLSSFNNLETIKMLLAKVGTPSVDFIVLLIRKPTLCDKDVPVLRMLLRANPAILNMRVGGSDNLPDFIEKTRNECEKAHKKGNLLVKLLFGYKYSIKILDDMAELVKDMKRA